MDYLAKRSQLAPMDGAFSKSKPIRIGVPQGSLLGHRVLITYVFQAALEVVKLTCKLMTLAFIPFVILLMRLL